MQADFDQYAENYDESLAIGLAASGENKEFFAQGRVNWLARKLRERGATARRILDYGCGTGGATPFLLALPEAESVLGVDVSASELAVARRTYGGEQASFSLLADYEPRGEFDLVFCNGVFHHIARDERSAAIDYARQAVRPGGWFALWDNNPWNPGARYVMHKCPFDCEAVMVSASEMCKLLRANGCEVIDVSFQFIFPRALRWLRPLETSLARWPLGAQYQVMGRRR